MTIKTAAVAFASLMLLTASTRAGDLMDELATIDLDTINESAADVEEFDLASLDMDNLAAKAGEDEATGLETDAIETCFRRFGGYRGGRGWRHFGGYRNYGFGGCYSYCRPAYRCYQPIVRHCYQPVVRHCY
ncbi:unnamed protein product, partial [Ectocarpus sp. 4 AP-2014]